jgi:glycosyltransferase involved in cell wall biosynthesis
LGFEEIFFLLLILALTIQVSFYGMAMIRFARFKPYDNPLEISDQPLSVIICARNELDNLKNLLPKLLKQAYAHYEIVVVNDRSDDGTYDYLQEEKLKTDLLKIVHVDFAPDHIHPKKYAITLGVRAATYDLVLLTDADCDPASIHWIKSIASQFGRETNFVLGFSYYLKHKGFLNRFIRYETIQTGLLYLSAAIGGNPYMGVGRNLAYRKSFFLSVKGFNKDRKVVGGDDDLLVNRHANKKNARVIIGEHSLVNSIPKREWNEYFIQKKRHLSAGKRYKLKDKFILSLFYLSKIVFWLLAALMLIVWVYGSYILGCIAFMLVILLSAIYIVCKKTGAKFELWWVSFMELAFVFYLLIIGSSALISKRIKWN